MTYDENDIQLLALCVYREARGEQTVGMRAVACVIKNRIGAPGFASTLHDVIMGKNQFSSMSRPSDPQFNLIPDDTNQYYQQALDVARQVLAGECSDVTYGSLYYACLRYADPGGWFVKNIVNQPTLHPHRVTIGNHDFYA